jgi:hypothetical protein
MARRQVDAIRDIVNSKNKNESELWKNHYGEMAKKTVMRRHAKRLQLPELQRISEIDNTISNGMAANITERGEVKAEPVQIAEPESKMPTPEEVGEVYDLLKKCGYSGKEQSNYLYGMFQTDDLASLTKAEVDKLSADLWKQYDAKKGKTDGSAKSN